MAPTRPCLPPLPPLPAAALGLVGGLLAHAAGGPAPWLAAPLLTLDALAPGLRSLARGVLLGLLLGAGAPPQAPPGLPRCTEVRARVRTADPRGPLGQRVLLALEQDGGLPAEACVDLLLAERGAPTLRPGDRFEAVLRLGAVPAPRNPGARDLRPAAQRHGVGAQGALPDARLLHVLERGTGLAGALFDLRAAAAERLSAHLPPRDAGLARALVLGDRDAASREDRALFREAGQQHLVAVSGQHVALVLAAVLLLGRRLGAGRTASTLLGLAAVLLYVPISGAAPSSVRSGMGAALWLIGRLCLRRPAGAPLLAAVALLMLSAAPADLGDPGFALSFGAVLGIEVLSPRLTVLLVPPRPRLPGLLEPPRASVRRALAVSLAAWLGSAPVALVMLGQIHPLAALLALPAVPLTALLLGLGALALLPAPCGAAAAVLFHGSADLLRLWLAAPVALGVTNLEVRPPGAPWLLLSTGVLLVLGLGPRRLVRWALLAEALLLVGAVAPPPAPRPTVPVLWVLDAGLAAPAHVLLLPDGEAALLDAGSRRPNDAGRRVVLPALRSLGVSRLRLALVTRDDPERLAALDDVLEELPAEAQRRGGPERPDGLVPGVLLEGSWGRLEVLDASPPLSEPRAPGERDPVLRLATAEGVVLLRVGGRRGAGLDDLARYAPEGLRADVLIEPPDGLPPDLGPRLAGAWHAALRVPAAPGEPGAQELSLERVPVLRPWSGGRAPAAPPYDPAMPVAPAPSLPAVCLCAALLALFAGLSVRPLGWLRPGGAAGAFTLGLLCYAALGGPGLAALFAPFLAGTLLGHLPGRPEERGRTLRQVVANGLPAGLGALLALLGQPAAGAALLVGGLACLGADTAATEVGTRYGGTPRSLLTGRPLRPGESGGVTAAGLAASLGGAFLAPVAYALAQGGTPPDRVAWSAGAGVAGALLDSLLGAGLQWRGRDPRTGAVTEQRVVEGRRTERVSGLALLDNDGVNLVSALAAAALAWALVA